MQPQSSLLSSHPLLPIPKHVPRPWAQVVADLDAKFAMAREGGGAKAAERMCNKGKKFPHEEFCTVFSLSSGPVTNYVHHPSRDRGIARDRGKPRDLSLSYVAHDRGNTCDRGNTRDQA
jgi:hypothetical protein